MQKYQWIYWCVFFMLFTMNVSATEVHMKNFYVRLVPPSAKVSAIFGVIESAQKNTLVQVSSSRAKSTELHASKSIDGVSVMREVNKIDIPAGSSVHLKPGGFHIMLIGLLQPLKEGELIDVNFTFLSGETSTLQIPVQVVASKHNH